MAILTEHEAGIWGATLATVQEQRERIAQLVESRQRAYDKMSEMRAALAFARSVIKSGEPWTETCHNVIDKALDYSEGSV